MEEHPRPSNRCRRNIGQEEARSARNMNVLLLCLLSLVATLVFGLSCITSTNSASLTSTNQGTIRGGANMRMPSPTCGSRLFESWNGKDDVVVHEVKDRIIEYKLSPDHAKWSSDDSLLNFIQRHANVDQTVGETTETEEADQMQEYSFDSEVDRFIASLDDAIVVELEHPDSSRNEMPTPMERIEDDSEE